MRGLTPAEEASLRRNMPGTPYIDDVPEENHIVNERMMKRGLLRLVPRPDAPDYEMLETTALGRLALYANQCATTLLVK